MIPPVLLLAFASLARADILATNTVQTYAGPITYNEDWAYTDVRPGAHMFWWLYANTETNEDRPLFLWLQGGPGSSGVGFGNFEELGPKTLNETDNIATWLQVGDLVFVDNPVGTGFSYVDGVNDYTRTITDIGVDLLSWAADFFNKHKEYRTRPFYIVCESYGGKMTAEFARVLYQAIQSGVMPLTRFKGVGLGDSWISAMDYVNTWGEYLYAQSYLDEKQLATVNNQAAMCQALVDKGKWTEATNCWSAMESLVGAETDGVSWYNVLKQGGSDDWSADIKTNRIRTAVERLFDRHVAPFQLDQLTDYMNTVVRQKLGIIPNNVTFGAQGGMVFQRQSDDFMTPNWATVDQLLNYGLQVTVFNGQLDLICDTIGTERWIDRLSWSGLNTFKNATNKSFHTASWPLAGYEKSYKNLQLIYILRAGHMVAHDTPETGLYVLQQLIAKSNLSN